MNERIILDKLESEKNKYDLKGVELTLEDAENVIELINGGMTEKDAIAQVLYTISEVLSEGFEC